MPIQGDVVDLVTGYLDGTLSHENREEFERHLETCDECQSYLEQVRRATSLTGRPPEQCLAREFQEHLTQVFSGLSIA